MSANQKQPAPDSFSIVFEGPGSNEPLPTGIVAKRARAMRFRPQRSNTEKLFCLYAAKR
jgi:hypothetical protein